MSENGYIQGAGDDSEGWSQGLTAPLFWQYQHELMNTNEDDFAEVISRLLDVDKHALWASHAITVKPTAWLFVGSFGALQSKAMGNQDAVITCGEAPLLPPFSQPKIKHIHLECRVGKLGSRDLRKQIGKIMPFLSRPGAFERLIICCPTGKDLSVGVALAVLCLFTDDSGKNP